VSRVLYGDSYMAGGCLICGKSDRDYMPIAHTKCWSPILESVDDLRDVEKFLATTHGRRDRGEPRLSTPVPIVRPSTTRTVDVTLLTRLSDFIASIPGNALDRRSNALAMTLRREIADVVCPADKVRK
jgi:hypothetical protein